MTSHITLECDFGYSSLGYACSSRNLNIVSPNVTVLRITGDQHTNTRNSEVASLVVARQNMRFIPENLAMFFRHLESLTVFKSNLERLRVSDLTGLHGLRKLFVHGNNLQFIDEDVLLSVPRLEILDLTANHIAAVPFAFFARSANLRTVTLSNNLIRIFDILPFPVDCRLEELRLDGNQLVRVNLASFMNARRLRTIDMHGNVCISRGWPSDATTLVALFTEIVHFCNSGVENGWIRYGH
jgi:Leucine-rich repeat (LRR) protein